MVSADSHRVSRAPRYSGCRFESGLFSPTQLSCPMASLSSEVRLTTGLVTLLTRSYNPHSTLRWNGFGLFRFRSPLLSESLLFSLPPGTEMVHFPGFARSHLWIQWDVIRFYRIGFPHSEIPGSRPACGSPGLIAACHVLHRLLLPRHPPCALSSLTIKLTQRFVLASRLAVKPCEAWNFAVNKFA